MSKCHVSALFGAALVDETNVAMFRTAPSQLFKSSHVYDSMFNDLNLAISGTAPSQ